jgi:hypothetical protein
MNTHRTCIVICPITGYRLCRDNEWRGHAHFGTGKHCVKEYKLPGAALSAGQRYRMRPAELGETIAKITYLNEGDYMNACGSVFRKNGGRT